MIYSNKILSTVVFTQNNRCKMIPNRNKKSSVFTKDVLNMVDIMMASSIVAMTSTMAILNMRYECTPSPDFPKTSLYLHNDIYNYSIIKNQTIQVQKYGFITIYLQLYRIFILVEWIVCRIYDFYI